jgi:hypothetical protein
MKMNKTGMNNIYNVDRMSRTIIILVVITVTIITLLYYRPVAYAETGDSSNEALQELLFQINKAIEIDASLPLESKHKNRLAIDLFQRLGCQNVVSGELYDVVRTCEQSIKEINPYNLEHKHLTDEQLKELKPFEKHMADAYKALRLDR